ncbi:MAG: hypothetical protein IT210_24470 [Armatimonadetes bacterium]|nr:hypothetical protein [Armatimonadota bacterium]
MKSRWMRIAVVGVFLTGAFITFGLAQQPPEGGPGGPGRGGGRNMMANMAVGKVVSIDLNNRAVQVQSQFDPNTARWVAITDQTKVVRQVKGKLSDLKEGDQISVQGIPTAIKAAQVQIGEMPSLFPGMRRGGPGGNQSRPGSQGRMPTSNASAQGKVTAFDPLTVTLTDKTEVVVTASENTPISKIETATFRDIKQNDMLAASGEPDEQGNLYAGTAIVGADFSQMMGGFGGRRMGGGRQGGNPPAPPEGGAPGGE